MIATRMRQAASAATSPPWYLSGDVPSANCIAAYQPIGAATFAASLVNLANPGVHDATVGAAPGWGSPVGWLFNGGQWLITDLVPVKQVWTAIVRFTGAQQGFTVLFGSIKPSANPAFDIQPNRSTNNVAYYSGTILAVAPVAASGVLAIAGNKAYRNGVVETGTINDSGTGPLPACYIGAGNLTGTGATAHITAQIQAIAFYDTALTADQVAAITVAMNALPETSGALPEAPPGHAIYASSVAAMDSNVLSGGGTDDTAALQAVLDVASDEVTPVYLVLDGCALVSGLKVYSNTTVVGKDSTSGLYLKAASHKPVITGGTPSQTVRTDQTIKLWNFFINGNGANQNNTAADGTLCVGVSFYSVADLTMTGVHCHDTRMYGVGIWNSDGTIIENYRHTAISNRISQDGINLRSTTSNAIIRNSTISSHDDAIALNNINWGGYGGPYVLDAGIIDGVTIENVEMDGCLFGIDILSDISLIDNVNVSGLTGRVQNYWLAVTEYDSPNGEGIIGDLTFDDITTTSYGSKFATNGEYDSHVKIHANIAGSISITNATLAANVDTRTYIQVFTGYTVALFHWNNFVNSGAFTPLAPVIDGTITSQTGDAW